MYQSGELIDKRTVDTKSLIPGGGIVDIIAIQQQPQKLTIFYFLKNCSLEFFKLFAQIVII